MHLSYSLVFITLKLKSKDKQKDTRRKEYVCGCYCQNDKCILKCDEYLENVENSHDINNKHRGQ